MIHTTTRNYEPDQIPIDRVVHNDDFIEDLTSLIVWAKDVSIIDSLPIKVNEAILGELDMRCELWPKDRALLCEVQEAIIAKLRKRRGAK